MKWNDNINNLVTVSDEAVCLSDTVTSIFFCLRNDIKIDFNYLLLPVNSIHLAMALRTTCSRKNDPIISGWDHGIELCKRQCILDNVDYSDLLFGML